MPCPAVLSAENLVPAAPLRKIVFPPTLATLPTMAKLVPVHLTLKGLDWVKSCELDKSELEYHDTPSELYR